MSLFKVINNEALEQDRMASLLLKKQILERVKDNIEKAKPQVTLDSIQKNTISRNFGIYERQLYKLVGYIEQIKSLNQNFDLTETTDLISKIILAYNNLTIYINSLNYPKLFAGDKELIDRKFKQSLSVLAIIENALKENIDNELLSPLSQIKNNIEFQTYQPVGFNIEKIAETEPLRREKQKEREELLNQQKEQKRKLDAINEAFLQISNISQIRNLSPRDAIKLARYISGEKILTKKQAIPLLISAFNIYRGANLQQKAKEVEQNPEEEEEEEQEMQEMQEEQEMQEMPEQDEDQ